MRGRSWLRYFQIFLSFVVLVACASEDPFELLVESTDPTSVCRQAEISTIPCGGCDDRCNITTDDPGPGLNIDTDPASDGYNADMTGYNDVPAPPSDGIILDGAVMGTDSDNDGISDSQEAILGTDSGNANGDLDGDGYPDAWEVYNSTDPNDPNDPVAGPGGDELYVVLPDGGPPITEVIPPTLPVQVRSADVYFLVDTTYSMAGEIANLANGLGGVVTDVLALIPDVQFGVGHYRDYADDGSNHIPYQHIQDITDNMTDVQDALDSLTPRSTIADLAESTVIALYATATGADIGCGVGARGACPNAGEWGYPCFRPDAQPIIVLVTDHEFHNGVWDTEIGSGVPGSCYEYSNGGCDSDTPCLPIPATDPNPSLEEVITNELNPRDIKVVGIFSGQPGASDGRFDEGTWGITYPDYDDAIDIWYTCVQTGSVDSSGVPFLYGISSSGTGIGADVSTGISDLVRELLLDVTSVVIDPDLTDAVDTTVLVSSVTPTGCEDCDHWDATTAYDVRPGTGVTFEILLQNTGVIPQQPDTQEYEVQINIVSETGAILGERTIYVLVPGTNGLITPPVEGTYWHIYEAANGCDMWETVHWQRLIVDMTTPAGTNITFTARTAEEEVDLITAEEVPLTLGTPRTSPVPLPALRYDADIQGPMEAWIPPQTVDDIEHLQITATLTAGTPGDTPTLHSMTVEYYCL